MDNHEQEQTFRSEDNAFLPLKRQQLMMWCVATLKNKGGEPVPKRL